MRKAKRYAVLIISQDGRESYVCDGTPDQITKFYKPQVAQRMADVVRRNLDAPEHGIQSVNVVPYPEPVHA